MAPGGVSDLMVQAIAAATRRSRELADQSVGLPTD
jgi:hypothetical protein